MLLFSRIHHLHPRTMACRTFEEACVKVGQTFLSALLIVLLPEYNQKKCLRRRYGANTRSSRLSHISRTSWKVRRVATGDRISLAKGDPIDSVVLFQWGRQLRVVACQYTGFRGSGLKYMSRQECLLHLFKPTLPANKV